MGDASHYETYIPLSEAPNHFYLTSVIFIEQSHNKYKYTTRTYSIMLGTTAITRHRYNRINLRNYPRGNKNIIIHTSLRTILFSIEVTFLKVT